MAACGLWNFGRAQPWIANGSTWRRTCSGAWPVPLPIAMCIACYFFVQSVQGAEFANEPLVKKRESGQVAGIAGAYGNVGAITFLTVFLFVSPSVFFMVIAAAAVVGVLVTHWLVEPANSFGSELAVDELEAVLAEDELEAVAAG